MDNSRLHTLCRLCQMSQNVIEQINQREHLRNTMVEIQPTKTIHSLYYLVQYTMSEIFREIGCVTIATFQNSVKGFPCFRVEKAKGFAEKVWEMNSVVRYLPDCLAIHTPYKTETKT